VKIKLRGTRAMLDQGSVQSAKDLGQWLFVRGSFSVLRLVISGDHQGKSSKFPRHYPQLSYVFMSV
jgi:hypothetical protein